MRIFLILTVFFLGAQVLSAQNEATVITKEKMKVVIQLTSNDSLVHKAVIRQIHNLLTGAPNTKVEVVCHSNGISMLQSTVTRQADKIRELTSKGVEFVACENTMRERKIKREELIQDCKTVPSGVVEVVMKQHKDWAYLKAGF